MINFPYKNTHKSDENLTIFFKFITSPSCMEIVLIFFKNAHFYENFYMSNYVLMGFLHLNVLNAFLHGAQVSLKKKKKRDNKNKQKVNFFLFFKY